MNFLSDEFSDKPGAPSLRKLAPCLPKPNCVPTSPHPPNLTSDPPKGHCGHNQNHLETRTAGKSTTMAMYPLCNNMQPPSAFLPRTKYEKYQHPTISMRWAHLWTPIHNGSKPDARCSPIKGQSIQIVIHFMSKLKVANLFPFNVRLYGSICEPKGGICPFRWHGSPPGP